MGWLKRVWSWFRRNWKWVVFPIGALSTIITLVAAGLARRYSEPPPDLDGTTRDALRRLRSAELERDRKIAELEIEHKDRLQRLSGDQQTELEELHDKPLEEVVAWFDNL